MHISILCIYFTLDKFFTVIMVWTESTKTPGVYLQKPFGWTEKIIINQNKSNYLTLFITVRFNVLKIKVLDVTSNVIKPFKFFFSKLCFFCLSWTTLFIALILYLFKFVFHNKLCVINWDFITKSYLGIVILMKY